MKFSEIPNATNRLILIMFAQNNIIPKRDTKWFKLNGIVASYKYLSSTLSNLKKDGLVDNKVRGTWTLTLCGESEVRKLMQQYDDDMHIPTRHNYSL